jgi:topoisomerase IV subunit B
VTELHGSEPGTSHDWARGVDAEHLALIQQHPEVFAPDGIRHLILEVVAYAADEAGHNGAGQCVVALHGDGSVSVADSGRGTAVRVDDQGTAVKKPVMSTKDLRFFDSPDAELLPDGHPRRGMSVVAALSEWLVHVNRRLEGAWMQRYEHGIPSTGLEPAGADGMTGTTVHFSVNGPAAGDPPTGEELAGLIASWPCLSVTVEDRRAERPAQPQFWLAGRPALGDRL